MEDEQNQNQVVNQNVIIGQVLLQEEISMDCGLAPGLQGKHSQDFTDPSGYWAKFFAPGLGGPPAYLVPSPWANFFTAILMSPKMFDNAKQVLKSAPLMAALDEQMEHVGFKLPQSCPSKVQLMCLEEIVTKSGVHLGGLDPSVKEGSTNEIGASLNPDLGKDETFILPDSELEASTEHDCNLGPDMALPEDTSLGQAKKKNAAKAQVIVDSEVRRSPRLKGHTNGFMKKQCNNRACLGCNASPPAMSFKAVRKLGASMCGLDPLDLPDEVLLKKMKTAPVGQNSSTTADAVADAPEDAEDDADKN